MKDTLIVYSSNRDVSQSFFNSIRASIKAGAELCEQVGTADVVLARNLALTRAVNVLKAKPHFKTILMVDDDMSWTNDQAQTIIDHSRLTNRPTSACYVLKDNRLAAFHSDEKWSSGLGFLAIPAETMLDLTSGSRVFDYNGISIYEFTKSGIELGSDGKYDWIGEDYYFTRTRLQGVELLPVAVSHSKMCGLQPNVSELPDIIRKYATK